MVGQSEIDRRRSLQWAAQPDEGLAPWDRRTCSTQVAGCVKGRAPRRQASVPSPERKGGSATDRGGGLQPGVSRPAGRVPRIDPGGRFLHAAEPRTQGSGRCPSTVADFSVSLDHAPVQPPASRASTAWMIDERIRAGRPYVPLRTLCGRGNGRHRTGS